VCESSLSIGAIAQLLVAAVAVEAAVEVFVDSEIFSEVRSFIKDLCYPQVPRANARLAYVYYKLNYFINCGYCMSVWVAAVVALGFVCCITGIMVVDWFITTLVLHRLSNLFHVLFMLVKHGRVHTLSGDFNHIIENKK
jgi:hypothetical protein